MAGSERSEVVLVHPPAALETIQHLPVVFGISGATAVNGKVSSWYMIWGYGFYSLGELLVSGLGLAMIARYVPARMGGFMMGAYFVATGISQYLASVVANFASTSRVAQAKSG